MTFKLHHRGRTYTWIEKGARAALTIDSSDSTTRLLWMGDPCDPAKLRELNGVEGVSLALLLELSRVRKAESEH